MLDSRFRITLLLLVVVALSLTGWAIFRRPGPASDSGQTAAPGTGLGVGRGSSGPGTSSDSPPDASETLLCMAPKGDAARVDDISIPLERLCARLASMGRATADVPREQARIVLDQMIDALLVRRALAREGASVSDVDVSAALVGIGAADASPVVRDQMVERLEAQTLARARSHVEVTDEEVAAELARGAPAIDRGQGMRVDVWLARVAPNADAAADAAAEQSARAFAEAVRTKAPAAAATEHHMAALARFVVGANGVEPELERAAFGLEEGQWSEAIRTRVGWAVLRVVERAPPRPMAEDLLRARVRLALENQKLQKAREDLRDAMRALAKIEILVDL